MTPEKVLEVLGRIRAAIIAEHTVERPGEPVLEPARLDEAGRKARWKARPLTRAQFAHLLFIVADAEELLRAGRTEKMHRHLGWSQGALCLAGLASIDELMEMNRPDERKATP